MTSLQSSEIDKAVKEETGKTTGPQIGQRHGTPGGRDRANGISAGHSSIEHSSIGQTRIGQASSGHSSMLARAWPVIALAAAGLAAALLLPALPQPLGYHQFADRRALLGIANVFDVASNLGFLIVGVAGVMVALDRRTTFEHAIERWPYALFFTGVALTAFGSAYYHWLPDNERLFWDRLPMMLAFMSLIAAQISDRISLRAGLALLLPLLALGLGAVFHWIATERTGAGNVIPYAMLQTLSVLILLAIALRFPSRYTRGGDLYLVFALYAIAKLAETFDHELLALGQIVSGHTLKHLAAAVAAFVILRSLRLRRLSSRHCAGLSVDSKAATVATHDSVSAATPSSRPSSDWRWHH
jgi:hypothetical protein